ncbi:hypothetical protein ACFYXF_03930 [Streptomyces sp. NPDC002680]|uniref:hypothetical protein n=1 Tax=Streptomyces sp. NPDC002680 TaxID=3364659 RepID=UPI00368CE050
MGRLGDGERIRVGFVVGDDPDVVVPPAGVFVAADEFGAQRVGNCVEEVGAQLGPALGCLVDQVPAQGVEVAAETVLAGAEQQGQVVAGVSASVDVDAGIPGVGGTGDEGTGVQRFSKVGRAPVG